jgi:hypothetical protein
VLNSHRSQFDFDCGGSGCKGRDRGSSAPTTTSQNAQIQGQVQVQPGIFTALQLSFDYNILQGRAGPEPFLLGTAIGCGAVSSTQTAGSSTTQTNSALTADVDWGILLRAEALAGGERIGERWETKAMRNRHIWFGDMAPNGSSALVATLTGPTQVAAAQPAAVKVRMPSCFPYNDKVEYRVTWNGNATPAANSSCQWQAGGGRCNYDPAKELALSLTWATPGTYSLSVALVKDTHRDFNPAPPPATLSVTVAAAGGTSP